MTVTNMTVTIMTVTNMTVTNMNNTNITVTNVNDTSMTVTIMTDTNMTVTNITVTNVNDTNMTVTIITVTIMTVTNMISGYLEIECFNIALSDKLCLFVILLKVNIDFVKCPLNTNNVKLRGRLLSDLMFGHCYTFEHKNGITSFSTHILYLVNTLLSPIQIFPYWKQSDFLGERLHLVLVLQSELFI